MMGLSKTASVLAVIGIWAAVASAILLLAGDSTLLAQEKGRELFSEMRCDVCHSVNSRDIREHAPRTQDTRSIEGRRRRE